MHRGAHQRAGAKILESTTSHEPILVPTDVEGDPVVPYVRAQARRERMHRTLKAETTKPAGDNFLQQQGRFDDFIEYFNHERPHQALDMGVPAEQYARSARPYTGLPSIDYPFHDKTVTVTACGRICLKTKKVNLSNVFSGQKVGIKQVDDRLWLTSFMTYDLGYFDEDSCRLEPIEDPFGSKVLPRSSE